VIRVSHFWISEAGGCIMSLFNLAEWDPGYFGIPVCWRMLAHGWVNLVGRRGQLSLVSCVLELIPLPIVYTGDTVLANAIRGGLFF
jgi:hypothetical protein